MNYDYNKKRTTMIAKIMREMEVELEEATQIYTDRLSNWGKKGGDNATKRYKFTTETAREAHKKRKV